MINQIDVLVRLQSICNKLRKLNSSKELLFNDVNKNKEEIEEKKDDIEKKESSLKSIQMKIDSKELDLKGVEDGIGKFKVQLNQIKTNKEYTALKDEIKSKELDKSVLEDEVLEMMNELEETKDGIQKLKDELRNRETQLSEMIKAVEVDVKGIENKINEEDSRKISLIETLDDQSRYHFERLIKNKNGIAVAEVVNTACQSCYFAVSAQTINLLLSGKEIVLCNSCGRILFLNNKENAL